MKPGIVGRMVMAAVTRGERRAEEPCEVVACTAAGSHGGWKILVATHDGALLDKDPSMVRLIADPDNGGPYR